MQVIVNNIINGFVYEFLLFTLNIFSQESCPKRNCQKMNCWQCNIMGTSTSWSNSLWGPLHGGYLDEWMLFYWSGGSNIMGTFTSFNNTLSGTWCIVLYDLCHSIFKPEYIKHFLLWNFNLYSMQKMYQAKVLSYRL